MFGKIQLERFDGITTMPQEVASAWSGAFDGLLGAEYKPLLYLGKQIVHGVNYYFIAEQTLITANPERHIVIIKVNALDGKYTVVGIEQII